MLNTMNYELFEVSDVSCQMIEIQHQCNIYINPWIQETLQCVLLLSGVIFRYLNTLKTQANVIEAPHRIHPTHDKDRQVHMQLYQLPCRKWTTCTSNSKEIPNAAHLWHYHCHWYDCIASYSAICNAPWRIELLKAARKVREVAVRIIHEVHDSVHIQFHVWGRCYEKQLARNQKMPNDAENLYLQGCLWNEECTVFASLKCWMWWKSFTKSNFEHPACSLHVRFAKHCLSCPSRSYSIKQSTLDISSYSVLYKQKQHLAIIKWSPDGKCDVTHTKWTHPELKCELQHLFCMF